MSSTLLLLSCLYGRQFVLCYMHMCCSLGLVYGGRYVLCAARLLLMVVSRRCVLCYVLPCCSPGLIYQPSTGSLDYEPAAKVDSKQMWLLGGAATQIAREVLPR